MNDAKGYRNEHLTQAIGSKAHRNLSPYGGKAFAARAADGGLDVGDGEDDVAQLTYQEALSLGRFMLEAYPEILKE